MDNLFKSINISEKDVDVKSRTITVVGSKEVVDRDADLIKVKGIDTKNYKQNPVVLFSHNYSERPIASAEKVWVSGDELKVKIKFCTEDKNPGSESLFKMYSDGDMKAFSIGFIPDYQSIKFNDEKEIKKTGIQRIFNKCELLEISAVSVPSNPAALVANVNKSWEKGIIDGNDLQNIGHALKSNGVTFSQDGNLVVEDKDDKTDLEDSKNIDNTKELEEKVDKLEQKIKELEELVSTKDVEVDFNSYLTDVFKSFEATSDEKSADGDHINDDDNFDNYLDDLLIEDKGEK